MIRHSIVDYIGKATRPPLNDEERRRILFFVGGGGSTTTSVEFAEKLHDLVRLHPKAKGLVKIAVLEATYHILNLFDKRITTYAEEKFHRDGSNLQTGSMVLKNTDEEIPTEALQNDGAVSSMPYAMLVLSISISNHPVIMTFMKKIGQANGHALATDECLRLEGIDEIYVLGDFFRRFMEDIAEIDKKSARENSGILTVKVMQKLLMTLESYPQIELKLKSRQLRSVFVLMTNAKGDAKMDSIELNIEELRSAFHKWTCR